MFVHNINPTLLELGPLEIRWYGLMYVLAFLLAFPIMKKLVKRWEMKLHDDDINQFLLYLMIGMLIGARLLEVLYYNPSFYLQNPAQIIAIWKGGLSFHGGLLGMIIAGFLFARKKHIPFLQMADLAIIPGSLGLAFGRLGNFINGELVGTITNVPWCVYFKGYEGCRHPSQLYELVKNLIIFSTFWHLYKEDRPKGFFFFLFLILYAILRSIIEQWFRQPQAFILGLTQGQFLNVFMLIAGIVGMWYIYHERD